MNYRVAILGCRSRGQAAGRAYHVHPRTEVVAICDLVEDRLNGLGDELGVNARYRDLDAMMREERPDIVAIPTGTEFHCDLGLRVLEYGAHIDVEKPICIDLEEADRLVAKATDKNCQIAVHHQGRTGSAMRAVEAAYQAGKIGELRYVSGSGKGYYGGYGLMNIGTHTINAMLELTGSCRQIFALATTGGRSVAPTDVVTSPSGMGTILGENISATLAFDKGVTATLTQHRFPTVDSRAYHAEFFGTEGRLYWGNSTAFWLPHPHQVPCEDVRGWEPITADLPGFGSIGAAAVDDVLFVDEYVNALDEGRPHASSGLEGVHVLEIMMGVFESAAFGSRVDLPQKDRSHPLTRWRNAMGQGPTADMPRPYAEWLAAEDARLVGRR
jgi:predicted dehydrogenase